jgi:serine/threonine protein kinase
MQKKKEGQWRATLWKTELMNKIHSWNLIKADLLTRLGTADPAERLSAAAALAHPWFTEHAS